MRSLVYRVRLELPAEIACETHAVELPLHGAGIDALIGREILQRGTLIYAGADGFFTLTF